MKQQYTQGKKQMFYSKEKLMQTQVLQNELCRIIFSLLGNIKIVLSYWSINILSILLIYYFLGKSSLPYLLEEDSSAQKNQQLIRYVIKGTLIYCLGWVVIMSIHEHYSNDYMKILKAKNRQGFKRICLLVLRVAFFFGIALKIPANHYSNRLLSVLTLYIWISQEYIQTAIIYNYHALTKRKMQFVCNVSMNQATSLVFIMSPLTAVLAPELPWLPGFITLFPIFCRFTQCYIVGTHEQFLNSIKFSLNLIAFGFSVVQMPFHSHYWRIVAAAYSFYWDIFRDWKWKIRFIEEKNWRIDLPMRFFFFGFFNDLFARTIWIIFPMNVQDRGIVEMTRRLAWMVFYFNKPPSNKVRQLDWWFTQ